MEAHSGQIKGLQTIGTLLSRRIPGTGHYKLLMFHMQQIVPTNTEDETYNGSRRLDWIFYVHGRGDGERRFSPM